jgi:hypothetical protein
MCRSSIVLALCAAALLAGCRKGPRPRITLADVERCELGVDLAAAQPAQEAMSTLYRSCSDTFAEVACREAYRDAATVPPERQTPLILLRCANVYCPYFSGQKLAACDPAFVMSPLGAALAWPPLHEAILDRDASGYAPRLRRAFLRHGVEMAKKPPPQ